MKRKFTLFLLFSLLFLALGLPVRLLHAHAEYDHSEPAADATVETAPTEVKIWFTQELFRRKGENLIEVFNVNGDQVALGDLVIDDDDRTLASVALSPDLSAGMYTVRWRATSAEDGHQEKGEFRFTVGSSAEVATQAPISETEESTATATSAPSLTTTPLPTPTALPSSSPLTCFGVSMPLMMVVVAVLTGRKSRKA